MNSDAKRAFISVFFEEGAFFRELDKRSSCEDGFILIPNGGKQQAHLCEPGLGGTIVQPSAVASNPATSNYTILSTWAPGQYAWRRTRWRQRSSCADQPGGGGELLPPCSVCSCLIRSRTRRAAGESSISRALHHGKRYPSPTPRLLAGHCIGDRRGCNAASCPRAASLIPNASSSTTSGARAVGIAQIAFFRSRLIRVVARLLSKPSSLA